MDWSALELPEGLDWEPSVPVSSSPGGTPLALPGSS